MLLNDFFTISELTATADKITARIRLNAEHEIYKGHFPSNPITPGVVQIEMVKEILGLVYKKEFKLKSISRCKFLKILNPNETPELDFILDLSTVEHFMKVSTVAATSSDSYFKLSAIYQ